MYFYIIRHMVKILIIIDHCILLCTTSQSHTKPSAFSQQTILRNWAPWRHIRWKGLPMDQLTYGHCIRYSIHRLGIPKFYQDQGLSMVSLQMAITRNMMINLWIYGNFQMKKRGLHPIMCHPRDACYKPSQMLGVCYWLPPYYPYMSRPNEHFKPYQGPQNMTFVGL